MSWEQSRKPRKYEAGEPFTNMRDVARYFATNEYFWLHNKPQHPEIIRSMQYRSIESMASCGMLRRAKITDSWMTYEARDLPF